MVFVLDDLKKCNIGLHCACIYGIYVKEKLIYIGRTQDLYKRMKVHKCHIVKEESKRRKYLSDFVCLYEYLRQYDIKDIGFSPLWIVDNNEINELSKMERMSILKLKPICNIKLY